MAAAVGLFGWVIGGPLLRTLVPHGPAMKVNAAVALFALSVALLVARRSTWRWGLAPVVATALVVLSLMIVALTSFEYVSGLTLGIDELIVRDRSYLTGPPGRMAASTLGAIALLSLAVLSLGWRIRAVKPAEWLALAAALIATLALIGDLFGSAPLSGLSTTTQMATSTAVVLELLGIAVVAARRDHLIFQAVAGPHEGAKFLRRFGAIGILVPFALGYLVLRAGRAGAYGEDFAQSLGTFVAMAMGLGGVVTASAYVRRAELAGVHRREAEVFKMIVETANEGIWTTDNHGRTLFMNDRMLEMLGYESSEVIGKAALDLAPQDIQERQNARMQARQTGRTETYETAFVRKDGSILWALVGAAPRLDADGDPAGSLAMVSDMTARRAVEEALLDARKEAIAASDLKSAFVANMSHEIRTPMNGVLGMTELLRGTPLNAEQAGYAEAISGSGEALLTIINDILDFSKIEAGKLDVENIEFDLRNVVEEAAELVGYRAHHNGVELVVVIEHGVPERVLGDPVRLRQVMLNLISNAAKFTESGEIVVRVRPSDGAEANRRIEFEVSDTGAGISEEGQKKLFENFSQGEVSTSRKFGGTGLGLVISRQLVSLMGGEIRVRSTLGQGSTFYFSCLFGAISQVPVADPAFLGLRVLVVDDNETSRSALEQIFLSWSVDVAGFAHGIDALDSLRTAAAARRPFDIVLLDQRMPALDGGAVARMIRSNPSLATSRLILMTSTSQPVKAGMFAATLSKPVKLVSLRRCIADVMGAGPALPTASFDVPLTIDVPLAERPLVLVVDDSPVNQRVSVAMLGKLGYRVELASNGHEAVSATSTHDFAAILMDCNLPLMNGYEATAAIRSREGSKRHTPIIAMTASAMKGDLEKCIAAGMDDYASKPVKMAQLGAIIAKWIAAVPELELNGVP